MPLLEVFEPFEDLRISRVQGKTLFEKAEENFDSFEFIENYLNLADQLLMEPEGVVPSPLSDRELFQDLSSFYLEDNINKDQDTLDFLMV